MSSQQPPLGTSALRTAVAALTARDPHLASLYAVNGVPPLWRRDPGFASLVRFVLEQQVSLASAAAAYRRLEHRLGTIEPGSFLALDDDELRRIGFSRQKTGYVRDIASAIGSGSFGFEVLATMTDGEARRTLQALRGVGPWTADCYLLFCLGRPDAWPSGDRALQVAVARTYGLDGIPATEETDEIADSWRPWRSVAARMLWHDYLGGRAYVPPP